MFADSRHAPPVTGTKDPGGCLWLPLGLAAKGLVVSEADYFWLSPSNVKLIDGTIVFRPLPHW